MLRDDMIDTLTTINYNYNNDKAIKETLEHSHRVIAEKEQREKEALEKFQNENTYILKWILLKFVKDYKFDWENKTVIVWWFDGVKTHVHCMEGDEFDPEVGFMKCLFKRALGSGNAVKKYFKEKIPELNAVIVVEDDWPEDTEEEVEDTSIEDYVAEELEKVNY